MTLSIKPNIETVPGKSRFLHHNDHVSKRVVIKLKGDTRPFIAGVFTEVSHGDRNNKNIPFAHL